MWWPFITLTVALYAFLFREADDLVRPWIKQGISRWLQNFESSRKTKSWPEQFAAVFDSIFGKKHFSWRCFRRSCYQSFACVCILTLFWWAFRPEDVTDVVKSIYGFVFGATGGRNEVDPHLLTAILIAIPVTNVFPDYISLLETRYLISRMNGRRSMHHIFFFLFLDFIFTIIISLIGIRMYSWAFSLLFSIAYSRVPFSQLQLSFKNVTLYGSLKSMWADFIRALTFQPTAGVILPSWGIFFYATFFTSIWLWLYILAGQAIKVTEKLDLGVKLLNRFLDLDNKPIRSIGWVAALIILVVLLILMFINYLIR